MEKFWQSICIRCLIPGVYGEHGSTTVGLSGHKSLPIYNHVKASRFTYDVVYTNTMQAGAYRGYGEHNNCGGKHCK